MKKTVLNERHHSLGARLAPYAGYEMPIQYSGIIDEHLATRRTTTIFDTCHMGEFAIRGPSALDDLERLVSCRVASLEPGRCRYGLMCNEQGGVIDDLLVYRLGDDDFQLVVNAGVKEGDWQWIREHASRTTMIEDLSEATAKIDLQGPQSPRLARRILQKPIDDLVYFSFATNRFKNRDILVSRTGYTGEMGFEFYGDPDVICELWDACLEAGAVPAGLGARDTLRLEMGMPLYGHELDENRNAAETGFIRPIDSRKKFIGATAIRRGKPKNLLCGIRISGRRAARAGDTVSFDGENVGVVTSGCFAPSLEIPVALAYVRTNKTAPGTELTLHRGNKELNGTVAPLPFYADGTARNPLSPKFQALSPES